MAYGRGLAGDYVLGDPSLVVSGGDGPVDAKLILPVCVLQCCVRRLSAPIIAMMHLLIKQNRGLHFHNLNSE